MCWVYTGIIAPNIPQMKITAVSQWTARFNIQRKHEKCWYLLRNLSVGLFDHKKISGLFQNFSKISGLSTTFQDSFQIPGLSKTLQDWWEPWTNIFHEHSRICVKNVKLHFLYELPVPNFIKEFISVSDECY